MNTHLYRKNIRESMETLPNSIQRLLTLITGKPTNKQDKLKIPGFLEFFLTLLALATTTLIPILFFNQLNLAELILITPVCWCISTGCLRKLQVTYAHHAVHNCLFSSSKTLNQVMLSICTIIPIVQNGKDYKTDHLGHHDNSDFTTDRDSDAAFLLELGFRPGKSMHFYKKLLFRTITSPGFHIKFLKIRILSHLIRGSYIESIFATLWLGVLASLLVVYPLETTIFVLIPISILYNISSLLQFLTEHAWLVTKEAPISDKDYEERCWGRFLGEAYPTEQGFSVKTKWWLKMGFVHAPMRISVLCGDLPVHDWHHLAGKFEQSPTRWQESIYLRQKAICTNGKSLGERELWGLKDMIMHSFFHLSRGEN